MIEWGTVGKIVSSWIVSPLLAGGFSCLVFLAIQRLVLYKRDMVGAARKVAPFLIFLVLTIISLVTIYKGLKPLSAEWKEILGLLDVVRDVDIGTAEAGQLVTKGYVYNPEELWFARPLDFAGALLYAAVIGLVSAIGSIPLLKRITVEEESPSEDTRSQNPLIGEALAPMMTKIKKLEPYAQSRQKPRTLSLISRKAQPKCSK